MSIDNHKLFLGGKMTEVEKPKSNDINITLPQALIDKMDAKCASLYKRRSEYIRDLILANVDQGELKLK